MQVTQTSLPDVMLLQPRLFEDDRGCFAEVFSARTFAEFGLPHSFVQDNYSRSRKGVLRGLHYQVGTQQGKLIRVLSGEVWDVAVDLRPDSPDFGRWAGFSLSPFNSDGELQLLWIPEGFAHGFLVLSETAEITYKTTNFYDPSAERCLLWSDPTLGVAWPLDMIHAGTPILSAKDAVGKKLVEAELAKPKSAFMPCTSSRG